MRKIKFLSIIIMILFLTVFFNLFIPLVNAMIYLKGFEGGTVGQQYGDTEFYTTRDITVGYGYQDCWVFDNYPYAGTRDYYIFYKDYFYMRNNLCSFYYNYTNTTYMTSFKMYLRQYTTPCYDVQYAFMNSIGDTIINIKLNLGNPLSTYYYQSYEGTWIQAGIFYTLSGYDYIGWDILENDTVRYYTYLNTTIDTPKNITDDMRIVKTKLTALVPGIDYKFLIDNIYYTTGDIPGLPSGEEEEEFYTFYFRFRDITTGNVIHWKGKDVPNNFMGNADYTDCYIISSYFTTGYGNDEYYPYDDYMPLSFNFTDGAIIEFTFSNSFTIQNFTCNIGIYDIYFQAFSKTLQIYAGQKYDIYLYPTSYIDGVNYNYCAGYDRTGCGCISVCLTKNEYDFGETVRAQYYLPTGNWLINNGFKTSGWYFAFFDTSEYFYGARLNIWDYIHRIEISPDQLDGNRHTFEFQLNTYNWHGYEKYYQKYECCILNYDAGWFDKSIMFEGLYYYCTGQSFSPNGSIESISPNPSYSGQPVTISFLSNGIGRLEINYPNGQKMFSQTYLYSDSIHNITKAVIGNGIYSVELYTYSAETNRSDLIDHEYLTVNTLGENGTYGSYGYGVPYLYVPQYRVIAGYDTISIFYRTYRNDSRLNITSPRGELTYFSTTVSNESDNVLEVFIESYMQLGTWNVSLEGGDIYGNLEILNTSFNVICEENSWIEFNKHTYYDNEPFGLYIKHGSYRISVTFYKNDIPQGESIIFDTGIPEETTVYFVPLEKVTPSIGYWRVEMWRINDRNIVYELAEWNCYVITSPYIAPSVDEFSFATIPVLFKILISLVIILITTISPLAFGIFLTKNTKLTELKIPSFVYVGFFMFGMSICVGMGIMDIAYIFAVLFVIAMISIIIWIKEKKVAE